MKLWIRAKRAGTIWYNGALVQISAPHNAGVMYLSIITELCHLEHSYCLPLSPSHYQAEYTVCRHVHASWHLILLLLLSLLLLLPRPFLRPALSACVSSVAPPGGMV